MKNKKVYSFFEKLMKRPFLFILGLGFVLLLIIEFLQRKNPATFFTDYIFSHPMSFIFDWFFICLSLSFGLFFKRKYFVFILVSVFWLTLGGANCYVLSYRTNPLCFIDLSILQISWDFISKYITVFTVVCGAILIALVVFLAVFVFRKAPKSAVHFKDALIHTLALALICLALFNDFMGLGIYKIKLKDMRASYSNFGFVYCFFRGTVERGIDEPENMSAEQKALRIINSIEDEDPEIKPNVIMIQLESFFDANMLENIKFSENPVPFYEYLRENYTWGKLSVPSIGAGTANTEFEIISQMDLDFFGTGEYPYKTILKQETPETAVWDFKELGYNAFALHNNNATFYDRNTVFATLGFDNFVTKEYFSDYKLSDHGWMKDIYLIPQIKNMLASTEGQDYIYTITVQSHGAYLGEDRDNKIKITETDKEDHVVNNKIEYYANQIKDVDDFIKELCTWLEDFEEPTVVVMYGDHMPSLDIEENELFFGDLFDTEYVMYSNYPIPRERRDLEAFQLSSFVMEKIGINTGIMTKIHQNFSDDEHYLDILVETEYDMLYGDKRLYGGVEKYTPTELKMGIDGYEARIKTVKNISGDLLVKGYNFTPSSFIYINGDRQSDTLKVSRNTLRLNGKVPEPGDTITVVQVSDDFIDLTSTEEYIYK